MSASLPPLFNINRLLRYLEEDSLLLTSNNRLCNKIIDAWGQYQHSQANEIWSPPPIFSIEQWLNKQWGLLQAQAYQGTEKIIINGEQERILWENITRDSHVMHTARIARDALAAYQLLEQWELAWDQAYVNNDMQQWITQYQRQLAQAGMITPTSRYPIITQAFDDASLPRYQAIYLLGFDDVTPIAKTLLNSATHQLEQIDANTCQPTQLQRVECRDHNDEMRSAAHWAKEILTTHDITDIRIGIIVPNLISERHHIQQYLAAELEPQYFASSTENYTLPFNISAGIPLIETPLIHASLQLLALVLALEQHEWPIEVICQILLSPFWGEYTQELAARCALVDKLQASGRFTISNALLRELVPEELHHYFAKGTQQTGQSATKKSCQTPSQWVTHFLARLAHWQWPGERTPNSQEYQQTQLWYQLLEQFAQLDSVLGRISLNDALAQCQVIASRLPFQEKVSDSPIQVLGILEGAGLQFTHCWVMGMDQQSWPPTAKPNPLLPIHIQREHRMPHSSSLRELDYAKSLTHNYRHCANTVIFSSATYQQDTEQRLEASVLIQDIPLTTVKNDNIHHTLYQWQKDLEKSRDTQVIDCAQGPTYDDTYLVGGTALLKAQAQNPFDAFIRYRVNAKPYNEPSIGFSAIEKGDILHQSLAGIWASLKTQAALQALDTKAIEALIQAHVEVAVKRIQRKRPQVLSPTLCNIETERQANIIYQWLDNEKRRPAFTVVATEEARTITLNNITLKVRIDRVDQLADGRFLIIDYKTGKASRHTWMNERLQEPQLPLYALSYSKKVGGIAFASINVEAREFDGLMHDDSHHGVGIKAINWEEALAQWQQSLTQILSEFQQGDCSINYIQGKPPAFSAEYLSINRYLEAGALHDYL